MTKDLDLRVIVYEDESGDSPFRFWLSSLKNKQLVERISLRVLRVVEGNFGDHKYLSDGVWELRMTFNGGIRIYYGIYQNEVILLLAGGNKASQKKDIKRAIGLWAKFQEESK
jgi:putative addiction module killer protein